MKPYILKTIATVLIVTCATLLGGCFKNSVVTLTRVENFKSASSDSDNVRLMDRRQLAQTIYETVKPVDASVNASARDVFKRDFFNMISAQTLARSGDLGRGCIYAEVTSASDPSEAGDTNCPDSDIERFGDYRPTQLIPSYTGGRSLSQVSACERVALFTTTINVNGADTAYSAADGFKSKVAVAAGVSASALGFQKSGNGYQVSEQQRAYIVAAFQVFYPGETPNAQVVDALKNVVTSTPVSSAVTNDPPWSNLFLALCLSPAWQTL